MALTTIDIGAGSLTAAGQALAPNYVFASSPMECRALIPPQSGAVISGSGSPSAENNVTFFCEDGGRGFLEVSAILNGAVLSRTILSSPLATKAIFSGNAAPGSVGNSAAEKLTARATINAEWSSKRDRAGWVSWSKIGEFNFSLDRTNEAGERPMDWPGTVLAIRELGENVIVYGDKGITLMNPVSEPATFGFRNLGAIGIKSAWSIDGTSQIHFFITSPGELWRFTEKGPENLGFKEWLAPMTNPVLNWDERERRLYISDGTTGYVFRDGLGGGYATLTGIGRTFAVGSSSLVGVPISIMTDILDLGHRGIKSIGFVEVGTNTTQALYVALDFRYTKTEAWRTSDWKLTNPEGTVRMDIAAVEFRVRVKQLVYDDVRIDYINLRHGRTDRRFLRGQLFELPQRGGEIEA